MTSSQEVLLSPLVSAKGLSAQRHVDALFANSKHFCAKSRLKAALSTGITVEYSTHQNENKIEDAQEERVILIMGFATLHEAWTPIIDMLLHKWDAVKHKRNVKLLSFDNRGMGGSDAPWWRYTTIGMALDALALMDYLGWESAHVVGLSMGRMISGTCVGRSTTCKVSHTNGDNKRQSLDAKLPEDVASAQMQLLFSDISQDQPMDFGSKTRREIIYEHAVLHAKQRVKPRFVGVMNQVMALRTHWVSDERLAAINDAGSPVLLVGGAMDILIPPREMQTLHDHLHGDHVHTLFFEQGGHGVFIQYPEEAWQTCF